MKSPLTLFASLMMLFGIVTMNSCTKNDIPELGTLKIESKVKYTEDLSQNPFVRIYPYAGTEGPIAEIFFDKTMNESELSLLPGNYTLFSNRCISRQDGPTKISLQVIPGSVNTIVLY